MRDYSLIMQNKILIFKNKYETIYDFEKNIFFYLFFEKKNLFWIANILFRLLVIS